MENSIEETDYQQSETILLSTIPLPALAFCLLWWVFLKPAAYTRARALPALENRLHRAMNLLVSTLLIAIPTIPLVGLTAGGVPLSYYGTEAGYAPQHWLIVAAGMWLLIVWLSYSAPARPVLSIALDGLLILLTSAVFILIIFVTLALPRSGGDTLIIALVAGLVMTFARAFEMPICWLNNMVSSRWIKLLLVVSFVSLFLVIIFFLALIVKIFNEAGLLLAYPAFLGPLLGINLAIEEQKPNGITKLVFAALPVLYAALIWIYWFGGWRVLGS